MSQACSGPLFPGLSRGSLLLLGLVAGVVALATILIPGSIAVEGGSGASPARTPAAHRSPRPSPGAADFGRVLVGTSTAYAVAHGDDARLADADCVEASPGRYMCSYVVVRPGRARECHLIQARWTPAGPSSFEVTLSGRAPRCGNLHEALRSLR